MKKLPKKFLLSVSLLCTLVSAQAHAFLDDFNIYYVNSNGRVKWEAKNELVQLKNLLLPDYPSSIHGFLISGSMHQSFDGVISSIVQDADIGDQKKQFKELWGTFPCRYGINPCYGTAQQLLSSVNSGTEQMYSGLPSMTTFVSMLQANYSSNQKSRKMIIITHGTGSIYSNSAVNYLLSHYPSVPQCIGVLQIATPASYIAAADSADGNYTTNDLDGTINALRLAVTILPANNSLNAAVLVRDPSGHSLITSYLKTNAATQVRAQLNAIANKISSTCPAPTPPERSCESTRTNGGAGGYDFTQYIGGGYHLIDLTFFQNQVGNSLATDLIVSGGGVQLPPRSDPDGINANDNDTDDASNGLNLWQLRFNGNGDDVYLHIHIASWGDTWSIDSHCH